METERRQRSVGLSHGLDTLTTLDWAAVGLALGTGLIHLYLFTIEDWLPFLLAGAGFLGAIVLLIALPKYRHWLYLAGVLFVLSQIVGYPLLPLGPLWIGVLDKAIQVVLIVVLVQLFRTPGRDEVTD
jgi:hypothetical protein